MSKHQVNDQHPCIALLYHIAFLNNPAFVSRILYPASPIRISVTYISNDAKMLSVNFSPFPTIETERLLLRSLSMDDLQQLYLLRTNEKVYTHLNKATDESIQATKAKIEEILDLQEKNDAIFWVITIKANPQKMIGNIGYWRMQKDHYRSEVGYILHPDHWQKGIMKEALNAVIKYGFEEMKLHSIEANINPDNLPSGALLESCGFIQEAYHKENYFFDGVFYDSIIYAKLNK